MSIKLLEKDVEVGEMKLKMQTLSMAGVDPKEAKTISAIKEAILKEKTVWFPLFAHGKPAGQIQIKTEFVTDDSFSVGSTVFEGGNSKKSTLPIP